MLKSKQLCDLIRDKLTLAHNPSADLLYFKDTFLKGSRRLLSEFPKRSPHDFGDPPIIFLYTDR